MSGYARNALPSTDAFWELIPPEQLITPAQPLSARRDDVRTLEFLSTLVTNVLFAQQPAAGSGGALHGGLAAGSLTIPTYDANGPTFSVTVPTGVSLIEIGKYVARASDDGAGWLSVSSVELTAPPGIDVGVFGRSPVGTVPLVAQTPSDTHRLRTDGASDDGHYHHRTAADPLQLVNTHASRFSGMQLLLEVLPHKEQALTVQALLEAAKTALPATQQMMLRRYNAASGLYEDAMATSPAPGMTALRANSNDEADAASYCLQVSEMLRPEYVVGFEVTSDDAICGVVLTETGVKVLRAIADLHRDIAVYLRTHSTPHMSLVVKAKTDDGSKQFFTLVVHTCSARIAHTLPHISQDTAPLYAARAPPEPSGEAAFFRFSMAARAGAATASDDGRDAVVAAAADAPAPAAPSRIVLRTTADRASQRQLYPQNAAEEEDY